MDEVPELVEEGRDVRVLHQPAREVAHEHALGELVELARPAHAAGQVELRRVLVLALARVQVEVDPAEGAGALVVGEQDVVRRHVRVPHDGVRRGAVGEAEEAAGDVEQALAHPTEVEVPAHLLGVDVEPLAAHGLGVEGQVGGVDGARVRHVLAHPLEQDLPVAPAGLLGRGGDPVDEGRDRRALLDHLDLGVERGPVGVAEQGRVLAADLEEPVQQRVVLRPAAVEEGDPQLAADGGVPPEGRERDDVRVVGGEGDPPVVADRVGVDPVLRQPGELLRADRHRAHVVADVLAELLPDEDGLLGQGPDPLAGRLVAVDAGAVEVEQLLLQQPRGQRVEPGRVDPGQDGVQVGVEPELGAQLLRLLHRRLGARAHGLERVHLGEERRDRPDVPEGDADGVPPLEHLGGVARRSALSSATRLRTRLSSTLVRSSSHARASSGVGRARGSGVLVTSWTLPADRPVTPGGGGAAGSAGRRTTSGS